VATNLVRFEAGDGPSWGVVTGTEIAPLTGEYPTTAALIDQGEADWREARSRSARIAMASAKILPPVRRRAGCIVRAPTTASTWSNREWIPMPSCSICSSPKQTPQSARAARR
jgi:hypothetical protein